MISISAVGKTISSGGGGGILCAHREISEDGFAARRYSDAGTGFSSAQPHAAQSVINAMQSKAQGL